MKRSPLGVMTLVFIGGILAARYTDAPFFIFWILSLSSLILSAVFLRSKAKFLFFLILSVFFLGGLVLRDSQRLPSNHISRFTPHKGAAASLDGVITSDPVTKNSFTTFTLDARRLIRGAQEKAVCGKVFVKAFSKRRFLYGERLLIEGSLYRVPYFRISKRLNYRDYLGQQRIYSILSAGRDSVVELLGGNQGNPLKAFSFRMRRRIKGIVSDNMSPFSGSILSALILGEREWLSRNLREVLTRSGTAHIIAISGLHAGLISFITLMILRILRMPKKLSYVIAASVLILYCILTGARAPVVRVTIMAVILFFGYIIGRKVSLYNVLSLAASAILLYNPLQLFNVSFQLSFVSIISILVLSPKIRALFSGKGGILAMLFSVSSAVWIGLLPLTAYYFNIVSPIAILANMAVVPYLSVVVGSGFLAILSSLLHPVWGCVFFMASEASIMLLIKGVSLLVRLPGAYFYLPDISFSLVILYYLSIAAVLLIEDIRGGRSANIFKN